MNLPNIIFSRLFEALAACLHYPRKALAEALISKELVDSLKKATNSLSPSSTPLLEGLDLIEQYVAEASSKGVEAVQQELAIEYTRLFINAYPMVPCPPYESFYVDGGFLAQASTRDVARLYAEAGYRLRPWFKDLPDHIAVELEFTAILLGEASFTSSPALRDGELAKLRPCFIKKHLAKWVPAFADCVERNAKLSFYKGVAKLLKGLVDLASREA